MAAKNRKRSQKKEVVPVMVRMEPPMAERVEKQGEIEGRKKGPMAKRLIGEALDAREHATAR